MTRWGELIPGDNVVLTGPGPHECYRGIIDAVSEDGSVVWLILAEAGAAASSSEATDTKSSWIQTAISSSPKAPKGTPMGWIRKATKTVTERNVSGPHRGAGDSLIIELRHADLNSAGHVGDADVARLVDEARTRFLGCPLPESGGHLMGVLDVLPATVRKVIGQQTLEYRKELKYSRKPLLASVWITDIGTSSFSVATVLAHSQPDPAVIAEGTYVLAKGTRGRPWPMNDVALRLSGVLPGATIR